MPAISIIIPSYNSEHFLEATLKSVVGQTLADWECIIVDDGSTDGSPAVGERYPAVDARFRYVRQPNEGRSAACNTGYAAASPDSRYLFFLDSDDLLTANALAVLRDYLEIHPEVGVVGCQYQIIDAEGKDIGPAKRSRWVPGWPLPRQLKDSEYDTPFVAFFCATGQGPFAMIRRSVYARTSGFEARLSRTSHEDTDLFCQLALEAPIHYLPERLYFKREHGANTTSNYDRINRGYIIFREKWAAFPARSAPEAKILEHARAYYRRRFFPLREFKVAVKALGEACRNRSMGALWWSVRHFYSGVASLLRP